MLIGHSPGIKHNEFLATTRPYGDFILSLNFRLVDGKGNSGVQFRSVRVPHREMSGYQADIGEGYWGCLYDESRRNKVLVPASANAVESTEQDGLEPVHRPRDRRPDHDLSLGGAESVNYHETEPSVARVRAAGGADPRRRADGGPVQGHDDSAAARRRPPTTRTRRDSICVRSRRIKASGSTRSTCPRVTTARRSSR